MTRCPTDTQLVAFHACELRDADSREIDAHLKQCETCAQRDAFLVGRHQSWVVRLRTAGMPQAMGQGLRGQVARRSTDAPNEADDAIAESSRKPFGVIAGYELERELARGGQGIVYLAVQRSTKRKVALKVLREGPFASLSARRRFEREIELVAGLRHPNIVQVYDSGVAADGRHYFVMDLITGVRLDHYAQAHQLNVRQRLELFVHVCEAVNYAHLRGIIHRDLKPSNILVDEQGQPRILDFGLARQATGDGEQTVTTTAMLAGTLAYLSPEQVRGKTDELDLRSDVYGLGVILYELLTGRHPYPVDGDMTEVLNHILETPPARPDSIRASRRDETCGNTIGAPIGHEVETIVLKALAKERERRYQTAGDLARDLRHFLAGEPIDAKRDSHWYILKKTIRRYRAAALAAAIIFAVVLGSAVALGVMYHRQSLLLEEVTHQQQLATDSESRASERFEDVRTLARSFIFELNPMISRLPGSTRAQAFIVEKALDYLDRLAAVGEMSPELKNDISAAYFTIGDIQCDPDEDSLGEPAASLESYHKGLKLLTELTGTEPTDMAFLNTHWLVNMRMSKIYSSTGQHDKARQHEQRAIDVAERMHALDPKDTRARSNLGYVRGLQANRMRSQRKLDEALAMYKEAAILEATADKEPLSDRRRHGMAQNHGAVGQVLIQLGRMEDALVEYRKCLDGLAGLVEDRPHNARFLNDLAISHERVSFLLQTLDRPEEALEHLETSAGLSESLLRVEPKNLPARANFMSAQCRLGEIHLARGDAAAARTCFDLYEQHAREMFEQFPHDTARHREWAVSHYKLYELHQHLAGREGASTAERAEHLRSAKEALVQCLREFEDMRARGVIWASDAGVPDKLADEIQELNRKIADAGDGEAE